MPDTPKQMPKPFVKGLIPTLNNMGFMLDRLDPCSLLFVDHVGRLSGHVLDLGCAYGVATLAALERGATVTACDIEPRHIEILESRCPEAHRPRLTCKVGAMPHVDFEESSFETILSARMLHFLMPDDLRLALRKIRSWLKPGATAFLITDTPFSGPWRKKAPEYRERKAQGDDWPGFFDDYRSIFPPSLDLSGYPTFINMMDPDILRRECQAADFIVERASFIDEASPTPLDSGAEGTHAAIICRRP